jgi:DNA-binding HxlR family transcriptional regulator
MTTRLRRNDIFTGFLQLRRLEASGYLARREVPNRPRETWYWLLPRGDRLIRALDLLDASYNDEDPGADGDVPPA